MVCAKDDQTLCTIRDVRPDAVQKRFSVTVRPHYTVATLYEDVRLQTAYSDFELNLIGTETDEQVPLHERQQEKLSDVGIKFGTVNNLLIVPRITNPPYLLTVDDMYSDDDLALGASASPVESGNYNIPEPSQIQPPMLQRFNNDLETQQSIKSNSLPAIAAPPVNSMSGGSIISNGYHHGDGGGEGGGGGVGRGRRIGGDGESGERAPHFRGLVNQAMTCYLNSLLQGLYMTPEFRNALYNWEFDGEDEAKSIPYQLQKLFVNLQTSPKSAVETTDLTRSFGWDSAEGWQQHDIQELCRVMFDALEHKFKRTEQADLINRLYQGHMIDYVKCLECNTEKQREDKFLDIPLPVRPFGSTVANECVEDALQGFVKPEILNESNQYFCDTCNKKCDAHKGLKFTKFPYILTLHLKRFDFDYQSFHRIKLNDKVTFPELLNLNHFVSSTPSSDYKLTTSTIAAAAAAAAAESSSTNGTANGNGPMMMETAENFMKSDECSTTDSGSALEEDSFQNGGTSVSSTTTTPNDQFMAQDDDEGIDMDLTTNGDSHSKSSPMNSSFNAPGPYKYELFAIMIHAGSASGGHYYAYIKDFKSGRWFSFNDQTVLPITQEDIHKSYGGGSYKTSYTGAYTSSTNAYMLMYRQIDSEKNALPISEELFPEHIKRLVMKIRANEGNHSRDHLDMTRITVAYANPRTRTVKGQRMAVFTSSTLAETVQEAIRVLHLKGTVPVERCRLVGYDSNAHTIERSFEGHEDKSIDEVMRMLKRCDALLLEVREEGETFEEYLVQGVMTKVYKVDVNARDVEGPLSIRVNLSQTVAQYRAVIARKLKLNPKTILIGMTVHKDSAKLLQNDDATLEDEHFIEYCKVFVTTVPQQTGDDPEQYYARFRTFMQRLDHLVSLYILLPKMEPDTLENLSIPRLSKETLAAIAGADHQITTTGTGDSNSEDSSLSDNDRTLVEDDFVHIKLNGDLHLTNGGNGALSNGVKSATTPTTNGGFNDDDDNDEDDEDAKLAEMLQECRAQEYYFKVTPLDTTGGSSSNGSSNTTNGNSADDSSTRSHSTDSQKLIQVLIDKRSCNAYLKYRLQSYLQISMDYFKVFSSDVLCPTNDSANLLKELDYKDDDRLALELGRVLRKGEYKMNVSYVNVNDMTEEMDNTTFLCSTIVKNGDLIGQIKKDILASLPTTLGEAAKKYAHLHSNNCRLRRKGIKYLSTVYKDDDRIGKDITMLSSVDVFLQEVDDLASLTPIDINDVVLLVRRWYPSEMKLGKFQEILFTDKLELTKQLSRISGIPPENVEYVKIPQTTLHRDSVLNIQNGLQWTSTPQHADDCQIYCVGTLLYYRDRKEPLKELTPEERKELTKKDGRTSSTYSPRKERALKIYLDASPKKADD
ncbi:ubiquitin carboxyl-terminal hydrolase 47 [Anopheles maculipalpis]|uniref:ubiquitin carboxyl-terminal hydrolase 47 n=1 Tax=Anopheles maculipalpis TaxID=1496333 RepID=UPI0021597F9C|nr:ubiquitin carboxyl-terminal hydrolase 47 [Anopheles maculipalpis]